MIKASMEKPVAFLFTLTCNCSLPLPTVPRPNCIHETWILELHIA